MSMQGVEHRVEMPWIKSEYEVRHNEILRASAFICRNGDNPRELLEMLGIYDDLQKLRICRRLAKDGTPPRMQGS
jgi:hypothetical protein